MVLSSTLLAGPSSLFFGPKTRHPNEQSKHQIQATRRVLLLVARLANRINGFEALNTLFLFVPFQMIPDILRAYDAQIGNDVEILGPIRFGNLSRGHGASYHKLSIGEHSKLSRELYLDLTDQITIESNVTFAMRVTLSTHTGLAESPLAALYPFCYRADYCS